MDVDGASDGGSDAETEGGEQAAGELASARFFCFHRRALLPRGRRRPQPLQRAAEPAVPRGISWHAATQKWRVRVQLHDEEHYELCGTRVDAVAALKGWYAALVAELDRAQQGSPCAAGAAWDSACLQLTTLAADYQVRLQELDAAWAGHPRLEAAVARTPLERRKTRVEAAQLYALQVQCVAAREAWEAASRELAAMHEAQARLEGAGHPELLGNLMAALSECKLTPVFERYLADVAKSAAQGAPCWSQSTKDVGAMAQLQLSPGQAFAHLTAAGIPLPSESTLRRHLNAASLE